MPVKVLTMRLVRMNLGGIHIGVQAVEIFARVQGHHDFFQGGVSGPFADAVDGAFDLPRSGFKGASGCWQPPCPGRCGNAPR